MFTPKKKTEEKNPK